MYCPIINDDELPSVAVLKQTKIDKKDKPLKKDVATDEDLDFHQIDEEHRPPVSWQMLKDKLAEAEARVAPSQSQSQTKSQSQNQSHCQTTIFSSSSKGKSTRCCRKRSQAPKAQWQ